jgi:hypothetical protein
MFGRMYIVMGYQGIEDGGSRIEDGRSRME